MTVADLSDAVRDFDAAALVARQQPVVLRGLVCDWPLVRAGRTGAQAAADYLKRFYQGAPVVGYAGPARIGGRFFYDDGMTAMNFTATRVKLDAWLDRLLSDADDDALYVGSTDLDTYLPGLRDENDLPQDAFAGATPRASIWIGNRTTAATHYDMSNNAACCIAGRRRFTLFPPEQIDNLYPGPLEPTPGGQAVSMVDLRAPDLARYPRFAEALRVAQVFDLEPGDVLVYPALWWHNVEALDAFNILINYWWNAAAPFLDSPMNTLLHGLLSLRDRPDSEKQAWRALFDYYVFGPADRAGAHLPEAARGPLAPLDALGARRLRAQLLQRLNR
ncbi:cupin-like domain-containing protein [Sphingomonas sp. NFR15]|uniref:cupin-like domain-containing protein n=1 Tax=Sphingomonas sp. NFR15 TaxID=1566282 RepID=UPI00087F92E1|nr:cupin-like domain-containing protein [Sphingomonas sp. NFR15]SDA20992.1 Cupin-like domain-containing protein [Sphingomonas sp. NFR15]